MENHTPQICPKKRVLTPLVFDSFEDPQAYLCEISVDTFFNQLEKANPNLIAHIPSNYEKSSLPCYFMRTFSIGYIKAIKHKLNSAKLLFWPILHNEHWYLIIMNFNGSQITAYVIDSQNKYYNDKNKVDIWKSHGLPLLLELFPSIQSEYIHVEYIRIPFQNNLYDCGPAICYWGEFIANHFFQNGYLPDLSGAQFQKVDYTKFRFKIVKHLY